MLAHVNRRTVNKVTEKHAYLLRTGGKKTHILFGLSCRCYKISFSSPDITGTEIYKRSEHKTLAYTGNAVKAKGAY